MIAEKEIQKASQEARKFQSAMVEQMIKLTTSGFGLVAALAWNNVIKEFVDTYVKRYFKESSGLISLLLYALLVTLLAVMVTYHLSKLAERIRVDPPKIKK